MLRGGRLWLLVGCLLCAPLHAQERPVIASPILTLDQERLFEQTGVTAIISTEVERRRSILAEENRRIEAELVAEETALTEQRKTLPAEEFRALADAFDKKVQALRVEQDAKAVALQRLQEEERQNFLRQMTPVLAEIVRERGALLVIDRRAAILSADAIDITNEAIVRMKAAIQAPVPGSDTTEPVDTP